MSIDLGSDRKDCNTDSPLCTPSLSSVSQGKSNVSEDKEQKDEKGLSYKVISGKSERVELCDQVVSQERVKGPLTGGLGVSELQSGVSIESTVTVKVKNQPTSQFQVGIFSDAEGDATHEEGELKNRVEVQGKDQSVIQSHPRAKGHVRTLSRQLEGGMGLKPKEAQYKGSEGDQFTYSPPRSSFTGEVEEVGRKFEDSGVTKIKFKKQISTGSEQSKKSLGSRDEESLSAPMMPVDQTLRLRQARGNQELNDELKMKANELEKLFAEHKLRAPGDQFSSARRSKPVDAQIEQEASSQYKRPAEVDVDVSTTLMPDKSSMSEPMGSLNNGTNFCTPPMKMVDNQDYANSLRQNFSCISFSDDSRGKFYERYTQKRDAKLREEWGSKRVEKEAKLKAMQDILEQSRDEMKAKFSSSADRQDSLSSARRRDEKVRLFNSRSQREQHPISSIQSEEDEDLSEFQDQKYYGLDRSYNEESLVDCSSRSSNTKKILPNRNVSLSTPRTTITAVLPAAAKISKPSSGRRRVKSENPLAQSVPNFSDLRKENTKPYSGAGKMTSRSQVRNHVRSKSINEEIAVGKDEQPRRSQSLRKGNGKVPGAGVKCKASEASETPKDDMSDELAFEADGSMNLAKEDEEDYEDELRTIAVDDSANMEKRRSRLSQESEKLDNSGSENGDSLRSLSQVDTASVAELSAAVPTTFHTTVPLQDSPGESPVSWNSRMNHPFSYPHETSDIDASVDSPIGSPTSWNSHPLSQSNVDAARMRKKWGSAQKPFLVANATHNQSRRDVTKGFKRLLKFGRKSRGADSLMDWISATTSEGDDDIEDGRDPPSRSSEDLRKSRMGFLQRYPSDYGFNEGELFNDQVQSSNTSIPAPPANFRLREDHMSGSSIKAPRSFFSLSTFRSKGIDSKPR